MTAKTYIAFVQACCGIVFTVHVQYMCQKVPSIECAKSSAMELLFSWKDSQVANLGLASTKVVEKCEMFFYIWSEIWQNFYLLVIGKKKKKNCLSDTFFSDKDSSLLFVIIFMQIYF